MGSWSQVPTSRHPFSSVICHSQCFADAFLKVALLLVINCLSFALVLGLFYHSSWYVCFFKSLLSLLGYSELSINSNQYIIHRLSSIEIIHCLIYLWQIANDCKLQITTKFKRLSFRTTTCRRALSSNDKHKRTSSHRSSIIIVWNLALNVLLYCRCSFTGL